MGVEDYNEVGGLRVAEGVMQKLALGISVFDKDALPPFHHINVSDM